MTPLFFQENGVYTIAKFILPNKQKNAAKSNLLQVINMSLVLQYQVIEILGNYGKMIYDFQNVQVSTGPCTDYEEKISGKEDWHGIK